MLIEWWTRFRFLLRPKARGEIDEELQFHLEQQTRANEQAGMPPAEARRQAFIAFGAVEQAREQTHQVRPGFYLESCLQDARHILRGFGNHPVFTLTIVVTLMLGIGATTAVFSVVDRILLRPLPYAHADQLVSIGVVQSLETQEFMLGYFYYDWQRSHGPFSAMTSEDATTGECDLTDANPTQLDCTSIEGNFLPVLGVAPVLGRNFLAAETRPNGPAVTLISYGLWHNRYHRDAGIVGTTIPINGKPVRVVGVLPRDFEMPRLQAVDLLFPRTIEEAADRASNAGLGGPRRVFARLNPGVSVRQAQVAMQPLFQEVASKIPADIRPDFHLKIRSLRDRQMQDIRLTACVLLGAVFGVLLIACANVASLLLARGASRQREWAVRAALGASRGRLARQALTESLLLSLAGAAAGCVLAWVLLHFFLAIAPANIPYLHQIRLDLRIVCATVALALVCGVLFGLAPALQRPGNQLLGTRSFVAPAQATLRQWLVVLQIAATMVLLAGAALLLRSFHNLQQQNLGMRTDNTVTASIFLGEHRYLTAASRLAFFEKLMPRLRFGPAVSAVSVSDTLPPASGHRSGRLVDIRVEGRAPTTQGPASLVDGRMVSPEYFRALDIPMIQGNGFREEDMSATEPVIVLSRRLAALLFSHQNPVGQHIAFGNENGTPAPWYTIAGVAADVKNGGLSPDDVPEYYILRRNLADDWEGNGKWGRGFVVVVRSALPPEQTARWIRAQLAVIDPTLPVDLATLRQRVSKLADQPRFQTLLVTFFAGTGLALALIGVYGVIAYMVAQRYQEIGIRMALGATRSGILLIVVSSGLRLIACGATLGTITALMCLRVLARLLFNISPHDPWTFTLVAMLLVCVALIACLIPARSASRLNPIDALRRE